MHYLHITIDGRKFATRGARITNSLRGYYIFELGPATGLPFEALGQPATLTLLDSMQLPQLSITGVTTSADDMLVGHSRTGLLDVASRSHRFETADPQQFLAAIRKGYDEPPAIECTVAAGAARPVEQHDQTDFEFLCHAVRDALIFDTGVGLRVLPRSDLDITVLPTDLRAGRGRWAADVRGVAISAAAHALDPGQRLSVEAAEPELAAHPELNRFIEAVRRFRSSVPAAKFLTTGRDREGLRKKLLRAIRRQLADSLIYEFRTDNPAIRVGARLTGLAGGPLVVVATDAYFAEGDFSQLVSAVPEPLAAYWGHEPAPEADALVLATVVEGADPQHLGRVPIVFADRPEQIYWARGSSSHTAKDFQVASRYSPGEEVVVGSLHGNPGALVILGSVFHGGSPPRKTAPRELLVQCGRLVVKFTELGFEVLMDDSRFGITADGITFEGKAITGKTKGHKWELK